MAILDSNIEIRNEDIYKRNDVVAFMEVTDGTGEIVFARMKGFTSLGTSKSVTEYTRQYVDEDFKRTTSTGFESSMGYAFDRYKDNAVLTRLANIADKELIGADATVNLLLVDMSTINLSTESKYTASALKRPFSVLPSSSGDSLDCYTYSGDFKACGEIEEVTVVGPSIKASEWLQVTIQDAQTAAATGE